MFADLGCLGRKELIENVHIYSYFRSSLFTDKILMKTPTYKENTVHVERFYRYKPNRGTASLKYDVFPAFIQDIELNKEFLLTYCKIFL